MDTQKRMMRALCTAGIGVGVTYRHGGRTYMGNVVDYSNTQFTVLDADGLHRVLHYTALVGVGTIARATALANAKVRAGAR
jgi:NAD(P)H-hydrate repair Nnr-like enzyme with NAD(P)H-hydrate dehydratase domain